MSIKRYKAGSMLTTIDNKEYLIEHRFKSRAVLLQSKIVPKDTRIIFDERGAGFFLLPYQLIEFPFEYSLKIVVPEKVLLSGSWGDIQEDIQFDILVFDTVEDVQSVGGARPRARQNFRLKTTGTNSSYLKGLEIPANTTIQVEHFSLADTVSGHVHFGTYRNLFSSYEEKKYTLFGREVRQQIKTDHPYTAIEVKADTSDDVEYNVIV